MAFPDHQRPGPQPNGFGEALPPIRAYCAQLKVALERITDLVARSEVQVIEMRILLKAISAIAGRWPNCEMNVLIPRLLPFLVDIRQMTSALCWRHYPQTLTWTTEDSVLPYHDEYHNYEQLMDIQPAWRFVEHVQPWADEARMQTTWCRHLHAWRSMEILMRVMQPRIKHLMVLLRLISRKLQHQRLTYFLEESHTVISANSEDGLRYDFDFDDHDLESMDDDIELMDYYVRIR